MKKSVIAFDVLITALLILIVFNLSKSQTINQLTQEKTILEQKVADLQKQTDEIQSQLDQANEAQKKQKEEFKSSKKAAIILTGAGLYDGRFLLKKNILIKKY